MNKFLACILTLVGLAVFVASAGAQPNPGPGGPMANRMMQRSQEVRPFSLPTERIEARLAYVRTALKITAAQQSQWDAYAGKLRQMAADREKVMKEWQANMAKNRGAGQQARPGAIERLERVQKFHADAILRINQLLEVQRPLYAALSSEQKKVADVVLAPRGGPRMNRGRMGPGPG